MFKLRWPLTPEELERREIHRDIMRLIPDVANAMAQHCSDMAKVVESRGLISSGFIKLWQVYDLPGLAKMNLSLWVSYNGKTSKLYLFNESTDEWNRADIGRRDLKAMRRLHDRLENMMADAVHFGIRDKMQCY